MRKGQSSNLWNHHGDSFGGEKAPSAKGRDISLRRSGVYYLIHNKTGRFLVGVCQDFYAKRHYYMSRLRAGEHPNSTLQALYNDDPHFVFKLTQIQSEDLNQLGQLMAEMKRKIILENVDNSLMLNAQWQANAALSRVGVNKPDKGPDRRAKPVMINQVRYASMKVAAASLKIDYRELTHKVHSKAYPNWQIIEEEESDLGTGE